MVAGEVELGMAPVPRRALALVRVAVLLQRLLCLWQVLPPEELALLVAAGPG